MIGLYMAVMMLWFGWISPADMMSFAAASTGMSSSITRARGT